MKIWVQSLLAYLRNLLDELRINTKSNTIALESLKPKSYARNRISLDLKHLATPRTPQYFSENKETVFHLPFMIYSLVNTTFGHNLYFLGHIPYPLIFGQMLALMKLVVFEHMRRHGTVKVLELM